MSEMTPPANGSGRVISRFIGARKVSERAFFFAVLFVAARRGGGDRLVPSSDPPEDDPAETPE